jgi:hypothetical protein
MIVLIAMLAGVSELVAVIALFAANAAMILFGLVQEQMNADRDEVDWRPFIHGCVVGAVPWIAIAADELAACARGAIVPMAGAADGAPRAWWKTSPLPPGHRQQRLLAGR